MSSSDYNLALLLQRQYEQENNKKEIEGDERLALLLQEQFKHEDKVENPNQSLTYYKSKPNSSKSLVDPSWELVDPTPNIHTLFLAFNQQFFWNQLLAVCVSWSKRMTTCAGICSYQGRAGLCSITLSEPLLKLRPRKDLVETLLHEMIHAYLFVTHNNKDRDGHGPEFHKHMYRINNEAGTNITVYHSFHDEVRLYKTHWWRCDGPCQHQKPYYGMVRRATNRAPGKNDRWWEEHSKKCGGNFIKVKEPEKENKSKSDKNGKENKPDPKMDIRNYFNKTITPKAVNDANSNIHTIHKSPNVLKAVKAPVFNDNAKIVNIHGFHNMPKNSVQGGTKLNGDTLVVTKTKKPSTITSNEEINSPKSQSVFKGAGKVLGATKATPHDYNTVRNHWVNKFNNNNGNKRRSTNETLENHTLAKKIKATTECPVCNVLFEQSELEEHLNKCLDKNMETCNSCNNSVAKKNYELHVKNCGKTIDKSLEQCEICDNFVPSKTIVDHMQMCLQDISMSIGNSSFKHKKCEICNTEIQEDIYDKHMEGCLLKLLDGVEDNLNNEIVQCLVCHKELPKKELNNHLEDCMNDSVFVNGDKESETLKNNDLFVSEEEKESFINDTSLIDEYDANNSVELVENDYIKCPVCDKQVLNSTINSHLDSCLSV